MKKRFIANAAWLDITTWVGIGLGATHYYGTISLRRHWGKHGQKKWEVEKKISRSEAIELNKSEGTAYSQYRPGQLTTRFNSEAEVLEYAISIFRDKVQKKYPEIKFLVLGNTAIIDPQPIIVGDDSADVARVNELAARAEKIHYWDSEKEMGEIAKEWEKLAIRMGYLHPDTH